MFYSRNLHDSKARQGEHFTQANKTRHYTPHNVFKELFSLIVKTNQQHKKMTIDTQIMHYTKAPERKGFVMGLEMV